MSVFNFLKRFHIHKWKYVYDVFDDKFLGETCPQFVKKFRICEKCGVAQEYQVVPKEGTYNELSIFKTVILKRKIEDMGDYYVLKRSFR